jgi:pSer/pThr/pTyr-binding forkhead associated (FHA) protein
MEVALLLSRILLIVLLYAFLGLIVVLLWRDVRSAEQRETSAAARARPARLVMIENGDGPAHDTTIPLKPYTSIGRASTNTIELADTYCSAEHALVSWRSNQWWLEDRGSRNGTLLNDVSVDAPVVLSADDVIRIGRVSLRFEMETATDQPQDTSTGSKPSWTSD